ncbi:PP2C family protein-serine/threonine phosphatase [Ketobacter sp.]|uniref:PP2C family protein-serine/threonine phosphatase n=1 Tax=Ketobacter sp. TaxID=2083498 RepID=UPI000F0F8420|nr:protein phosphatase 2C domain-containing protein [Ketobacter sp.]RLT96773.1 MAG: serine/threonine-protein phosphatase [Ketobacter sp.]
MDIFGVTDIGCVRKQNEDCIHWQALPRDRGYLAVLADGMGGYGGGALASKLAVEYFTKCLLSTLEFQQDFSNDSMLQMMEEAGALANNAIRQERNAHPDFQKMGTTLIAMLVLDGHYWLMHVGDSRCYCCGQDGLQALTRDHSLVQELVDKGSLTEKEAERAPFRNMLTRALGPDRGVQFSFAKHHFHPGESWLLCSDGLYNTLDPKLIDHWMQAGLSAQETAAALVRESVRQNAQDNVSVIVIKQDATSRSKHYGHISATGR